jgi:hypothetical protein
MANKHGPVGGDEPRPESSPRPSTNSSAFVNEGVKRRRGSLPDAIEQGLHLCNDAFHATCQRIVWVCCGHVDASLAQQCMGVVRTTGTEQVQCAVNRPGLFCEDVLGQQGGRRQRA